MEIPQKDNRETTNPKTQNTSPKMAKMQKLLLRYRVAVLVMLGVLLLLVAGIRFVSITVGGDSLQEKPISDLLNMADHHQLKSVTISGSDVLARSSAGNQYHAVKEDGQPITEILRRDGVTVNIDNGQRNQWAQGVVDLLLIVLVIGGMYYFIRRNNVGGQAMPFARSKARRFNESRPTVLFKDVRRRGGEDGATGDRRVSQTSRSLYGDGRAHSQRRPAGGCARYRQDVDFARGRGRSWRCFL